MQKHQLAAVIMAVIKNGGFFLAGICLSRI